MPNLGWFKIALTLILLTLLSAAGTAETLRFAAMGDLPYRSSERQNMPRWLTEISATQPAFILHVGDFKGSREECSDANFMGRYHLFNAASRPFIYTPGDNEWSDCDQRLAGGFDPVERLNKLRQIFFSRNQSLGQHPITVEQQAEAPENLRWSNQQVLFLTLNLPAGNNYGPKRTPSAEFKKRNPQILAWLHEGFAQAKQKGVKAIVIIFQANPGFSMHAKGMKSASFGEFLDTLQQLTHRLAAPVILIHGDTHAYRFDQPMRNELTGQPLANLWRIEVPGSPFNAWVEVSLHPEDEKKPVQTQLHRLE